jgi:hypothetical protein
VREHLPYFAELAQHRAQLKPDLEGLLDRRVTLRQGLEDLQRLFVAFSGNWPRTA